MKSLEILSQDATDRVFSTGTDSASIADLIGQISKRRKFRLKDNDGALNPLSPSGFFAVNDWRNGEIDYKNQDGQVQFSGAMKSISSKQIKGQGYVLDVDSVEDVGTLLEWPVEENDKTTHSGFLMAAAGSAGDFTLTVDTGTTVIPTGALVSFDTALVPRYQVTSVSGVPTTSITIDRGLEVDVADNTSILVSVPVERTAPDAIKLTLQTMGLSAQLDSTFDTLAAEDTAAGATVRLNIVVEENIQASAHLGKLMELMNGILTVNNNGQIGLIRGLEYRGEPVSNARILSDKEIIPDVESFTTTSSGPGLLIGYDVLYAINNNEVGVATNNASAENIVKWAPSKRWQPIPQAGNITGAYNYLYSNVTSAVYHAGPILDYYSVPRFRVKCGCKGSFSGNILATIDHQIGSFYFLNMTIAPGIALQFEPVRIVSYVRDVDRNLYPSIELELTNRNAPNLAVDAQLPKVPIVQNVYNIESGFAAVADAIPDDQNLICEVYDSSNTLIKALVFNSDTRSIDPNGQYVQNTTLTNGLTYSIRFAAATGSTASEYTEFFSITPADQDFKVGEFGVGIFTLQ